MTISSVYRAGAYMTSGRLLIISIALILLYSPMPSSAEVLRNDTDWRDEVTLHEDILVPEGVTLTVHEGTKVHIMLSESTKADPEYFSPLTEITVRGKMNIKGKDGAPVLLHVQGEGSSARWAGIIIDGGSVNIRNGVIENAETGIAVFDGSLNLIETTLRKNRYGIVLYARGVSVSLEKTLITENDYGILEFDGITVDYKGSSVLGNRKTDRYILGDERGVSAGEAGNGTRIVRSDRSCRNKNGDLRREYRPGEMGRSRVYGDETLLFDTVWRGIVRINGLIRVPDGVRLIITPGTVVEFSRRDTNGDGIGENGIMLQGNLIAKGTRDRPILFRSSENSRGKGDWDAINIMNSDGPQNLVEFVQIENAYRGLHFHFSHVMVNQSILRDNYRAIQFQESIVEMKGNVIYDNKSAIKARDSEVLFAGNYILGNYNGVNFFRIDLTAVRNMIIQNMNEGIKIREGRSIVHENLISCNRFGLMMNDSFYGSYTGNVVSHNHETGIAMKDSDNILIRNNFIQSSGVNGLSILSSGAVVRGNHISRNGERGIGIRSFAGTITENSIVKNGLYALDNEGDSDVMATMNWWGGEPEKAVYDREDDHELGRVISSPTLGKPSDFRWPLKQVRTDVTWSEGILIEDRVFFFGHSLLRILPGAKIMFSKGAGIYISESRVIAEGEPDKRILFTIRNDRGGNWDEILLEHSDGSIFSYCDFEHASWALHSHFTDLKISHSRFRRNTGGMRYRSGPVLITNSLFSGNSTGMRAFRADARVMNNAIMNNEIGVFVREMGAGLILRGNNISANSRYNIRVGDFNTEDIDARENWWGPGDPSEGIFDGRREPGVGKVIYEPYLKDPVKVDE